MPFACAAVKPAAQWRFELCPTAAQVLTSYVGVNGLIQKMAMDRCFPQALMSLNPWRFTNHWAILLFFTVTTSMCLLLRGNIASALSSAQSRHCALLCVALVRSWRRTRRSIGAEAQRALWAATAAFTPCRLRGAGPSVRAGLSGAYSISFLCVMILYTLGNVLLKVKRERLKREVGQAPAARPGQAAARPGQARLRPLQ